MSKIYQAKAKKSCQQRNHQVQLPLVDKEKVFFLHLMVLKSAIFNGKFFILRHFVHFVDFFFEMFLFCDDFSRKNKKL